MDTLAPSYLKKTALRAGAAAAGQEQRKKHKYRDMLPEYSFCAFGLETLGPMGPSARGFLDQLSRKFTQMAMPAGDGSREFLYLLQRLSLILIRANRMSLLSSTSGL